MWSPASILTVLFLVSVIAILLAFILIKLPTQMAEAESKPKVIVNKPSLSDEIRKDKTALYKDIVFDINRNIIDKNHIELVEKFISAWIQPYYYHYPINLTYFDIEEESPSKFFLTYYSDAYRIIKKYFKATVKDSGVKHVDKYEEVDDDGDGHWRLKVKQITLNFSQLDTSEWLTRIHEINTKIAMNK